MNYQEADLCRVCLQHGATIPIFDVKDSPDPDVYSKLCQCLGEKVEDVAGLPRNLCKSCLNKLDSAIQFVQQYKESEKLMHQYVNKKIGLFPDEITCNSNMEEEYLDENLFDESNFFKNDAEGVTNTIKIEHVEYAITGVEDIEFVDQNDINCDVIVGKLDEFDIMGVSALCDKEVKRSNAKRSKAKSENCSKKAKNIKKSQTKVEQKAKNVVKKVLGQKARSVDAINKTFLCKTCKKTFTTRNKLKYHRRKHGKKYKCPYCTQEFDGIDLPLHIIHIHPNDPLKPKVRAENRTYVCELCGIKCKNQARLYKHRLGHRVKKNRCPHCDNDYVKLSQHLATVHATSRKYSCCFCGMRFPTKNYCTQHEKNVHFKKTSLRYDCTLCDKHYTSQHALVVHMRSVHTGERPFVCDICNKNFTFKAYLKDHMRQHTRERPHKCPICDKGHTIVANVKSHLRHNHRISELDEATLEALSKSKVNYLKHMRP